VSVHGSNVLDSPSVRGVVSVAGHLDLSLGAWHHVLLGDAEVLAAHVVVSIEVLGLGPVSDGSGKSVGNWVEVPLKLITGNLSVFVGGLSEELASSLVDNGAIGVERPLLGEVELLLMVDDGDSLLLGQNHIVGGVVRLLKVEPEVSAWLHGGSSWLSVLVGIVAVVVSHLGSLWNSVAFHNLNFKVDVRVKRDWLSTEWGLSVGTTP